MCPVMPDFESISWFVISNGRTIVLIIYLSLLHYNTNGVTFLQSGQPCKLLFPLAAPPGWVVAAHHPRMLIKRPDATVYGRC
ncbi:hypothetical protein BO86DRAFT_209678 [Aspergillus japonicus CBS 114.51]|uniref:Uncharacterized protein n=1 Tax=Aspergillus japonicus CBS 114.51 TaxID=1448312 RepID=A0A8T8X9M6_ASPJA|nr:hypothetical protein BO86DRAFT_209678 [Aspergillus japonicus CBS 114.51]RAH84903.1 hypothetical protein BO86DRAFT_209678 [Aspergillus japonicus CBS 114.51]